MDTVFSLASITLFKVHIGTSVTAIGKLGWGEKQPSNDQIVTLKVPWQPLLPGQMLFSLLSWHTRTSEFAGRDDEMDQLREWANSDHPVRVKFVIGEGGVGKSRLGAEFAERMQNERWAAGFVDLRSPHAFPMEQAGTLLIIDYPEEYVDGARELLRDLTKIGTCSRLRVLLLTRQSPASWDEIVMAANARNIVERRYLTLGPLDVRSAMTVFNTTASEALKEFPQDSGSEPGQALVPEAAMGAWLQIAPENDRALFIMAAAVHSAKNPGIELTRVSGREVVTTLAEREVGRFQRIAEGRNMNDKYALARLLAMAALAGELSVSDVRSAIVESGLPLGFEADEDIQGGLTTAGLLVDGKVQAPKPDIPAAAFTVDVLRRRPEHASETVWAALKGDIGGGLERIGRLCWDSEIVLRMSGSSLSEWLAQAVEGDSDRCSRLHDFVFTARPPLGCLRAAVAVGKTLLNEVGDVAERASILNNLSNHLSDTGDTAGALAAVREPVVVYRRLAEAEPARFAPDLAMSLNNLSNRLSDTGDMAGALAAVRESVEVYRRLAKAESARFEPNVAGSLNNLSNHLSDTGDTAGALRAIRESVEVYRRLAKVEAGPV